MEPAPGEASTDVCSAGQVQFARAGSRVLKRKTLAGRDRRLDAVRRQLYLVWALHEETFKGPGSVRASLGIEL